MLPIRVLDFDTTFADVAVGEGCEEVILTFRQTSKGIRKTAVRVEHPDTSTRVPKHAFLEAHGEAVRVILQARREQKDPHFLQRKLGER